MPNWRYVSSTSDRWPAFALSAPKFRADYAKLDLLINNAGIMAAPQAQTTDGFDEQLGTNHLGPLHPHGRTAPGPPRPQRLAAPTCAS